MHPLCGFVAGVASISVQAQEALILSEGKSSVKWRGLHYLGHRISQCLMPRLPWPFLWVVVLDLVYKIKAIIQNALFMKLVLWGEQSELHLWWVTFYLSVNLWVVCRLYQNPTNKLVSMKATLRRQKKSYGNTKPFWRSHTATESQAKRRPRGWPMWYKWSKNPSRVMRRKQSHSRSWSLGRGKLSRSCSSVRWARKIPSLELGSL